ncbi:truncated hemoglobin YjbI [Roseimicrobium gellanilyticum]|uniref:Truncated hemoglobin YjbI n=1 Tax=Roseimicrobium gellanilyticum TaxID=748857 RepID=A0A366HRZ7_9BACT|nr:group 1 truncated hemoglobin [Roseimicrobium gellanilyticum]RBP46455.1 truncated hemoglobin YjbI [Roseimicrobium gellanilyticum]
MKKTILLLSLVCSLAASAAEPGSSKETSNGTCPVTGKPADPAITYAYEGITYSFADEASRQKFTNDRAGSLYQKLGGKAAIDAAVELFYVKVLADKRVNYFFEDINMNKQKRKQKEFLSAALGGPIPYVGKDLRSAHESLGGLNDTHFDAIAEHLQATLTELKVDPQLIGQAMAIVGSTRDAVLNRPAKPAAAATTAVP